MTRGEGVGVKDAPNSMMSFMDDPKVISQPKLESIIAHSTEGSNSGTLYLRTFRMKKTNINLREDLNP